MDWQHIISRLLENRTQQELAFELGCSQALISAVKNGERNISGYEKIKKVESLCQLEGIALNEKTPVTANN